jgi:hypothetical protein
MKSLFSRIFTKSGMTGPCNGIYTLTTAIGTSGSDRGAAVPPSVKRLGPKHPEGAGRQEMALDVEGVVEGCLDG